MKNYTEENVLRILKRKRDVRINSGQKLVMINSCEEGKNPKSWDLGIKSWGKIDYLRKIGYSIIHEAF